MIGNRTYYSAYSKTCLLFQLIQTISAIDTDDPLVGHKFVFSLSSLNPNFTIFDNEGE